MATIPSSTVTITTHAEYAEYNQSTLLRGRWMGEGSSDFGLELTDLLSCVSRLWVMYAAC